MKKTILSLLVLLFFIGSFMAADVTMGASNRGKSKGLEKKADTDSGLEDTDGGEDVDGEDEDGFPAPCLLYTSPSPRDRS